MVGTARGRHVAVVGGGIVGCAVAYALAKDGCTVTVIERDGIGAHASRHNAGNLNPLVGTPRYMLPFAQECFSLYRRLCTELAALGLDKAVATRTSRLFLAFDGDELTPLEEIATLCGGTEGFSARWLDRTELLQLEPGLGSEIVSGLKVCGNMTVDGHGLTRALAEAGTRLGTAVVQRRSTDIVSRGDRLTGIVTDEGIIACDAAVFATGPWVAQVEAWLGIAIPVKPLKGEILLMRLPGLAPRHDLTRGRTSLYRRGDGETRVGVTIADVGFDTTPTPAVKAALMADAARLWPDIARATFVDHVAALRPATLDGRPIHGLADGWRNVWIANGGGEKGLLYAVGIAEAIRGTIAETLVEPMATLR